MSGRLTVCVLLLGLVGLCQSDVWGNDLALGPTTYEAPPPPVNTVAWGTQVDRSAEVAGCGRQVCPGCAGRTGGPGCQNGLSAVLSDCAPCASCEQEEAQRPVGPLDLLFGTACGQPGGFFVESWLAQGFTGNTHSPDSRFNGPLTFNDRSNEYQMNQLYLSFGRAVDPTCPRWDVGGRVDLLYGTDYYFTTALGLETHRDGSPRWNSEDGPRGAGAALYGVAMPQLYAEVFAPFGHGLTFKMGHFYSILGYESVMAPANFFYSHAYTKQYGEPFTHTGLLASYDYSPCLTIHAGFTRGWDTWEDPNNTLGFLGGLVWTSSDETSSVAFTLHAGNEDEEGDNNRTVCSLVLTRQITCRLRYVFQHDFGVEELASIDGNYQPDSAKWYGINQYLFYKLSDVAELGLRAEWFRDQDNARVLAIPVAPLVDGGNYFALTLGMNWHPTENTIVRPEIRWDSSDIESGALGIGGMYDDFQKNDQLTLSVDLITRF